VKGKFLINQMKMIENLICFTDKKINFLSAVVVDKDKYKNGPLFGDPTQVYVDSGACF